jgi:hypothetical protein
MLHEDVEWPAFDQATTTLRLALRDVVEPGLA